jgi:hypothetical protein
MIMERGKRADWKKNLVGKSDKWLVLDFSNPAAFGIDRNRYFYVTWPSNHPSLLDGGK